MAGQVSVFEEILRVLEGTFAVLEAKVPPPEHVQLGTDYHGFRYKNQSVEAAVLQKCARLISGIRTSLILLRYGQVQELGVIIRTLDEFSEDILFLCPAFDASNRTPLHEAYLADFYQEEFDKPDSPILSTQKRKKVERKNIHAAIARQPEQQVNPSDFQTVHRTISQTNSGFVHASSAHVMEMYGGDPPHFHISGMQNTPRIPEYAVYLWNNIYRGLLTVMRVVLAFKDQELLSKLYEFRAHIEKVTGNTDWQDPEKSIRSLKDKK